MLHRCVAASASSPDPLVLLPLAHHNQPALCPEGLITCRASTRWRLRPSGDAEPADRRGAYAS
jgi:hypothetical protein